VRGIGLNEEETGGHAREIGNPAAEGRAAGIGSDRVGPQCTSSPRPWTGKTPKTLPVALLGCLPSQVQNLDPVLS
jgi:hypothetical protein